MNIQNFRKTYQEILPVMEQIVNTVNAAPSDTKNYAKHIDRLGAIIQYSYYVSLVVSYLPEKESLIVDWGGQYGQVTKLLQYYYPNTECYLPPEHEDYVTDHNYWHNVLDVKPVKYGKLSNIINYEDSSVDTVLSSGVLEHVLEIGVSEEETLFEINRILKKDGLFFIWNLPFQYGSVELLNSLLGRWHHERRYKKSEIIELLEKHEFEILQIDHHELMNMMIRNLLGKIIGHENAFIVDYYISKLPIVNSIAQHFTIVAKKKR
jgi:SAM-dependent methyltransferase